MRKIIIKNELKKKKRKTYIKAAEINVQRIFSQYTAIRHACHAPKKKLNVLKKWKRKTKNGKQKNGRKTQANLVEKQLKNRPTLFYAQCENELPLREGKREEGGEGGRVRGEEWEKEGVCERGSARERE